MNHLQVLTRGDQSEDESTNTCDAPAFESIVQARYSRRQMLGGAASAVALALCGARTNAASAATGGSFASSSPSRSLRLGFSAVPKSLADAVVLPEGYSYSVLYALGDPIAPGVPKYRN